MEEQSHKDEMRAALRGDFERLQARLEPAQATGDRQLRESAVPGESEPIGRVEPRSSWLGRLLTRG